MVATAPAASPEHIAAARQLSSGQAPGRPPRGATDSPPARAPRLPAGERGVAAGGIGPTASPAWKAPDARPSPPRRRKRRSRGRALERRRLAADAKSHACRVQACGIGGIGGGIGQGQALGIIDLPPCAPDAPRWFP